MESTLALLFLWSTQTFELPPGLLSALCFTESSHVTQAIHNDDGGSSSVGVCQVKLATARLLGFKGSEKQLRNPKTNIFYAGKYLRAQLDRYDGDLRKGVSAYNAGTHRVNSCGLTLNRKYVGKVFKAWAENR